MSNLTRETRIKKAIEDRLWEILNPKKSVKVEKEQLQAVSLGIKYLGVAAKLNENDWGKDVAGLVDPGDELDPDEKGGNGKDESSDDI